MRILFEFKCEDEHITESLVNDDVYDSTCQKCGKPATRIISAPHISLEGLTGDFVRASSLWQKKREQRMKIEQKAIDNHGPDAAWDISRPIG